MLRSVRLDNQPRVVADEVGDVVSDGRLSAELMSRETPVTQNMPEDFFGVGGRLAHDAGVGSERFGASARAVRGLFPAPPHPTPLSRGHLLPLGEKGRGRSARPLSPPRDNRHDIMQRRVRPFEKLAQVARRLADALLVLY